MSKRPTDTDELPGFYRDPITGRYFRKLNNDASIQKKIKTMERQQFVEKIIDANKIPASIQITKSCTSKSNIPALISCNQQGLIPAGFGAKFQSLRARSYAPVEEFSVAPNPDAEECTFVRKSVHGFIGVFHGRTATSVSEYELEYAPHCVEGNQGSSILRNVNTRHPFKVFRNVVDICDAYYNDVHCLLYACNSTPFPGTARVVFSYRTPRQLCCDRFHSVESVVWCCAYESCHHNFAVGSERAVYYYNIRGRARHVKMRGNVHSLTFSNHGQTLVCGTNNGAVYLWDCRTHRTSHPIRVAKGAILDVTWLADGTFLANSLYGQLTRVDLRRGLPMLDYKGHVMDDPTKIPISIDYRNDLLCATGTDNVTRLWSLKRGGEPLAAIVPPANEHKARGWLLNHGHRSVLCMFQGVTMTSYEPNGC